MDKIVITEDMVKTLYETKFVKLYDLQYSEGKHYFDSTRREKKDIVALKSDEEFKNMLPDAVTIATILKFPDGEERLLFSYEFRYPVSQFLLSPVAGLLDEEDLHEENPLVSAAIREIKEETGLTVKAGDVITVINPCAFSTPGMTDESNAFLCAELNVENTDDLSHAGAVGSELFNGFELMNKEEAKEAFEKGKDKYGNFFSLATWAVLSYFIGR